MRLMYLTLLLVVLVTWTSVANAEVTVKISGEKEPTTTIEGSVDVSADDSPLLKGSIATIHGNTLEIHLKESAARGDVPGVLQGMILKPELSSNELKGYLALTPSTALTKIDDPDVEELIEVEGGQLVSGRITQISDDAVQIGE